MAGRGQTGNAVRCKFEIRNGVSLLLKEAGGQSDYPTNRMQKGLLLACGDRELDEEGTGFGVPVIKIGYQTILPGAAHVTVQNGPSEAVAVYSLNTVLRVRIKGKYIDSGAFYRFNEYLASIHRNVPALRQAHSWVFNGLRRMGDIETIFETVAPAASVKVAYTIRPAEQTVHVDADLSALQNCGCTEIIFTNEQGANYFDHYRDSNRLALTGKAIGTWNRTFATEASFIDIRDGIAFTLMNVRGARMFRGRELEAGLLAWSGLAYSLPANTTHFAYDIKIGTAV